MTNEAQGGITVRELAELLMNLPQDIPVAVEGCDCYQPAAGVVTQQDKDEQWVLIYNLMNAHRFRQPELGPEQFDE